MDAFGHISKKFCSYYDKIGNQSQKNYINMVNVSKPKIAKDKVIIKNNKKM